MDHVGFQVIEQALVSGNCQYCQYAQIGPFGTDRLHPPGHRRPGADVRTGAGFVDIVVSGTREDRGNHYLISRRP